MSQEGYDELVAELQHMVNVELPAVRDAIAEARDKGDLSENFEYHAAKREQGKLLSSIQTSRKIAPAIKKPFLWRMTNAPACWAFSLTALAAMPVASAVLAVFPTA